MVAAASSLKRCLAGELCACSLITCGVAVVFEQAEKHICFLCGYGQAVTSCQTQPLLKVGPAASKEGVRPCHEKCGTSRNSLKTCVYNGSFLFSAFRRYCDLCREPFMVGHDRRILPSRTSSCRAAFYLFDHACSN